MKGDGTVLLRAAPLLFVLLWSSAFVSVRVGLEAVSPLLFLTARFTIAAAVLVIVAVFLRTDWPALRGAWPHLAVAGILINALYLAGAYLALERINASTMALIGALHPLATALIGWLFFTERLTPMQWLGLALGLGGVALVVGGQVSRPDDLVGPLFGFLGVLSLSVGSLYYRKFCREVPLRDANMVQLAAAMVVCAVLTLASENVSVSWSAEMLGSLFYLAVVISLGAPTLLMLMLRHKKASAVASNFYLIPGVTAIMGWALLGETLGALAIVGLGITSLGVWLAYRREA